MQDVKNTLWFVTHAGGSRGGRFLPP